MTENQYKADKYLSRYSEALRDLEYYKERLDEQRAKAESVKSTLGFERGVDKYGESHPIENDGTFDPGARERLLHVLIYQSMEYDNRVKDAEQLAATIERQIDLYCQNLHATALKYRYINLCTYDEIGVKMHISRWTATRICRKGLEEFGRKIKWVV